MSFLENEQRIRDRALEMAARSAVLGSDPSNVVDRAHYYAHYLKGDRRIDCNATCPFKGPEVVPTVQLDK